MRIGFNSLWTKCKWALDQVHSTRSLVQVAREIQNARKQCRISGRRPLGHVARAAFRHDKSRLCRIVLDLPPQSQHLNVDGAIVDFVVVYVDRLEQLIAREDSLRRGNSCNSARICESSSMTRMCEFIGDWV